ncbi:MAG: hypothetical protein RIS47_1447 [Bacteroidota bacterium]|jgi:6-pyruvoyltetrahydropterin/6-carboxytetrahydropterin synthase
MKATVTRKEHFNATHRLHNPNWDDTTNERVFGLCNNPNYHGHNYNLQVHITGEIDPDTGYVIDAKILSDLIKQEVTNRYDHKNLYLDLPDFANLNPTAENIAQTIWTRLRVCIAPAYELKITLMKPNVTT